MAVIIGSFIGSWSIVFESCSTSHITIVGNLGEHAPTTQHTNTTSILALCSLSLHASGDAWLLELDCRLTKWGSGIPRSSAINNIDDTGAINPTSYPSRFVMDVIASRIG
jgi:hypothetical protein